MTGTDWHASPVLLTKLVEDPRTVEGWTTASVEAHLLSCAACRRQLTAAADPAVATASWATIADRIDRPGTTLIERLLHRLGVGSGIERLVAATPTLRAAGLAVVAVLAAAAMVVSRTAGASGPFLVLAPLAPLAVVAATFAPTADPAGEAGVGTAVHGAGLVVRRAAVVVAATFGLLGVAAGALPDVGMAAAGWVLPALVLCIGALALGTWLRIEAAVAVLAAGWVSTVWSLWWAGGRHEPIASAAPFTAVGQTVSLTIAIVATAVVVCRRDRFATLEAFR